MYEWSWNSFFIQHSYERFADSKFSDQRICLVKIRDRKIFRNKFDVFPVLCCKCPQRMLDLRSKLTKNDIRNICWGLRAEINSDAFASNQFDDRFKLLK